MSIDVTSLYNRKKLNRWERVSVGDIFERLTYSFPNKEAIVAFEGAYANPEYSRITYREADKLANQFANSLLDKGLERADRILFFSDNSAEAFIAKIGVAKAGGVVAPVNTLNAPDIIDYLIDYVDPTFIIADSQHFETLKPILDAKNKSIDIYIPIGGRDINQGQSFDEFVSNQSTVPPEIDIEGNDIWEILFTSGTTSKPKGVLISHHSTYYAAYNMSITFSRNLKFEGDYKVLSFLPVIYHVGDQVMPFSAFLYGGTFVLGRKQNVEETARAISEESISTVWAGSPIFTEQLADYYDEHENELDFSSVNVVTYGWSALDPSVHDQWKRIAGENVVLWELFSQTESVAGFRFWHDEFEDSYRQHAPVRNYVGVPSPLLAAKIVDQEGKDITEPFVPGEVVYRTPILFSGYYKKEKETKEALKDGWFHSGDSVMYDENGLAIMVDRYKDIIKTGGENVSSIRVETAIRLHQDVDNAAVVGIPDKQWGEKVTAFVVLKEGKIIEDTELINFARQKLAGFETPKEIIFVDSLPETVGGKILKYKLRESQEKVEETNND